MRVRWRTVRWMTRGWLALVVAALLVGVGLSAQGAIRAISAHAADVPVPPPPAPTGYEAEEHFPGSQLLDTGPEPIAAPARGVTGTIALPALPIPAAAAAAIALSETGVVPARPFSMGRSSGVDRGRALQCLTAAIYYEAASEPDAGQQAVAQVVLNRVRHPAFPATVCGVVYQGSERAGCQFSFACDGAMARIPSRTGWARAMRAAGMALAGYVYAPVGLATHYHTYAVTPAWNRSLVMTDVVGAHFFHRWKGYWGTASAFRQGYAGGEPMPGPHAPVTPVAPLTPLILVATPVPTVPAPTSAVTPMTSVQPAYVDAGQPRAALPPAPVERDNLPPASQVLDKWKDSGKPL